MTTTVCMRSWQCQQPASAVTVGWRWMSLPLSSAVKKRKISAPQHILWFNHKPDYDYHDYDYITTSLIISHFVIYIRYVRAHTYTCLDTTPARHNVQWGWCWYGFAFAFHEFRTTLGGWGGFAAFNLIVATAHPNPAIPFYTAEIGAVLPVPRRNWKERIIRQKKRWMPRTQFDTNVSMNFIR